MCKAIKPHNPRCTAIMVTMMDRYMFHRDLIRIEPAPYTIISYKNNVHANLPS